MPHRNSYSSLLFRQLSTAYNFFPYKPRPSGIGGGIGFSLDPPTDPIK